MQPHDEVYQTLLFKEAVAADTWYILVDLDDQTSYKHPVTGSVNLLKVDIDAEKDSDGVFDLKLGVVRENDGTDGSADWIYVFKDEAVGNPTDSTDRYTRSLDFTSGKEPEGLDCSIVGSRLKFMRGPNSGNDVALKNDAADLTSAAGGSGLSAAVGDLVLLADETADTGTVDIVVKVTYTVN